MLDRKIAPQIETTSNVALNLPQKQVLKNGIELYYLSGGAKDVMKIDLIFEAGKWQEEQILVSSFTAKMLKEGTEKYNSKSLSEALDYYGASVRTASDLDYSSITIYCLTRFLEPIMEVVEQIILFPTFPEEELEKLIANNIQHYKVNTEKTAFLASREFKKVVFGAKNPYGTYHLEEDYQNLNVDLLKSHYQKYFNAANAKIFISGKFGDEELKIVSNKIEQIDAKSIEEADVPFFRNYVPEKVNVQKIGALQAALRIGLPALERSNPDFHTFSILNTIFGGYFGSRLMSNIREEKGLTYGIYSAISTMKHKNYYIISTEVNKDNTELATNEIFKEMNRLKEQLIGQEELNLVKNYILGSLMQRIDGTFKTMEMVKGLYLNALDKNYFDQYLNTIKNITAQELLNCAKKYFNEESFSVVIAKD